MRTCGHTLVPTLDGKASGSPAWLTQAVAGEVQVLRNRGVHALSWASAVGALVLCSVIVIDGPGPDPQLGDYIAVGGICLGWAMAALQATQIRVELSDAGVTV
jgi:hypothetical protein